MTPADYTNNPMTDNEDEAKLRRAEERVARNLDKFETSIDHLAEKVDESSRMARGRAQHVIDRATAPKRKFMELKSWVNDRARAAIQYVRPYWDRATRTSNRIVTRVRSNPRPYALGAAGIVSGAVLFTYMMRRQKQRQRRLTVSMH